MVKDSGARFENMVAMHLLKWIQFEWDSKARELELRYFRDIDGREVDFIVLENAKPIMAIECKWSDHDISSSLNYFKQRFPAVDAYQISMQGQKEYISKTKIHVCNSLKFLRNLI